MVFTRTPAGSIILTKDDFIFYSIGESINPLRGALAYVPERKGLDRFKLKKLEGKFYRKVFGAPFAEIETLISPSSVYQIERGWNYLLRIPSEEILEVRHPQDISARLKEKLPLETIAQQFSCRVEDIGIGGSVGVEFVPSQIHDIDLFFYGKGRAPFIWRTVRNYNQKNPLYIEGKFYHARFFYQDYWYCVHVVPQLEENELKNLKFDYLGQGDICGTITRTPRGAQTTPTIVELSTGITLISYRPGHASFFRKGDNISVRDVDFALLEQPKKKKTVALLTRYQWVEKY